MFAIAAASSAALADDEPHADAPVHRDPHVEAPTHREPQARPKHELRAPAPAHSTQIIDPRVALGEQITAEAQTIDRTLTTVSEKLTLADALRLRRMRAAYRMLHAPLASDASGEDRMVSARRRAAARLLLDRDASERGLLASEAERLHGAQTHATEAATQLPKVTLPESLGWPAQGKIARHFGVYEHERSRAMLSRRGVDLEVDDRAAASAPADGIVRYVGSMRGLDHGVILDHGDYYTVIAKLGELTIPVGTHVSRGDHLGRALGHRVYLEVRVKLGPGGLPIDPEPLLAP